MSNKRLILTIGGLLLGVSQINAMTNFKRFAPVLVGAAALAQTQVVKAESLPIYSISTVPDKVLWNGAIEHETGFKVDVGEFSKKEVLSALYRSVIDYSNEIKEEIKKSNALRQREIDEAVQRSMKQMKEDRNRELKVISFSGGGFQRLGLCLDSEFLKNNVSLIESDHHLLEMPLRRHLNLRTALKDLKPVADQEFKRCSRNPLKKRKQYNANKYQSPEERKELAHYFDEGADICRGGGYRELLGLK